MALEALFAASSISIALDLLRSSYLSQAVPALFVVQVDNTELLIAKAAAFLIFEEHPLHRQVAPFHHTSFASCFISQGRQLLQLG